MKYFLLLLMTLVFLSSCSHLKNAEPETKPADTVTPADPTPSTPTTPIVTDEPKPEVKPDEKIPVTVVVPGGSPTEVVDVVKSPEGPIKIEVVPGQTPRKGDFSAKSSLKVIAQLAKIGNCVLEKTKLKDEISKHKQFDYTTLKSSTVATNLFKEVPTIISTYQTTNPFSSTIAYRNVGSNTIYINTRKLGSTPTRSRLNTIWHERSHVAGFGHGNNSSAGKSNSVPYGTGTMSEKYFDECLAASK